MRSLAQRERESDLNYQMITTNDELASLCEVTRDFPAIALDTEFVRTRTYYPQLGLIQMYDGKQRVADRPSRHYRLDADARPAARYRRDEIPACRQ